MEKINLESLYDTGELTGGDGLRESLDPYVQKLVGLYEQHSDAEFAAWSEGYFRNHFKFLGIRTPLKRKLTNQFIKAQGVPRKEKLKSVISSLWSLPEREYQRAALDLLQKMKKELSADDMGWLTGLVVENHSGIR